MRKVLKKSACLLTAVALSATMVALPAAAEEAHAAEKPYMKSLKLKWDLKKNKAVTSKEAIAAYGKKPLKITVKNYKVSKAKKGYKKASFTITYVQNFKPTKRQVDNMVGYGNIMRGGYYFSLVDYTTGKSLLPGSEMAKQLDVTTRMSKWTYSKAVKYKGSKGNWVKLSAKGSVKVTVTFPETYKGLCLGVSGMTFDQNEAFLSASATTILEKFDKGTSSYGKTALYKKGKTNSHWMRIK